VQSDDVEHLPCVLLFRILFSSCLFWDFKMILRIITSLSSVLFKLPVDFEQMMRSFYELTVFFILMHVHARRSNSCTPFTSRHKDAGIEITWTCHWNVHMHQAGMSKKVRGENNYRSSHQLKAKGNTKMFINQLYLFDSILRDSYWRKNAIA
jgi:hypothetical protein